MGCNSLTVRSADAVSSSRQARDWGPPSPHTSPGRCPPVPGRKGPQRTPPGPLGALARRAGCAVPAGLATHTWRGTASGRRSRGDLHHGSGPQPQVTPGRAQLAGFTLAAESRLPASAVPQSPAPPRALPARFPSQFLPPELSPARLPPPSLPVQRLQITCLQLVPSPNSRAAFLNPVLFAAASSVLVSASAGQPPLEPRGQRGGAGVLG